MAMLPVILQMVDDIYSSLDDQSKGYANSIPMLFVPQRSASAKQVGRCPCGPKGTCGPRGTCGPKGACGGRKCQRGACTMAIKPDEFNVAFDVKSFKPEEVSVKVKGHEIVVEGKHDEREDEYGFVTRQFSRRFVLPEEYDIETVSTFLDAEGRITIKAQKPQPPAVETNERIIQIQLVPSVVPVAPASENGSQDWEKVEKATDETTKKAEEAKE